MNIARIQSLVALALFAATAQAQYKVVAPDGSVTYTDRPPAAANVKVTPMSRRGSAEAPVEASALALPPELRAVAVRYPVLLYTTPDCPSCDSGRQLLQQRGVPYVEKRVVTEEDAVALERALGWRTVPSLTIGAQALRGSTPIEWSAYLDAAGYPKESRLPRSWQPPKATPLVDKPKSTAPVAAAEPPPQPAAVPAPPESSEERPSIRF